MSKLIRTRQLKHLMKQLIFWRRKFVRPSQTNIDGVQIHVDEKLYGEEVSSCIYKGGYELDERHVLKSTVEPDDRIVDLGGGIGLTSILASKHVRDSSEITIVEANPRLIPIIKKNMALNGVNLSVIHGAAGHGNGTVDFYLDESFWSSSTIENGNQKKINVPLINFDTLIKEKRPTYLIVDIEGGEVELLEGLDKSIIKKLCLEIHPQIRGSEAISNMVSGLLQRGFILDFQLSRGRVLFFN